MSRDGSLYELQDSDTVNAAKIVVWKISVRSCNHT